jgi:hypothetical protein
MKKVILLFLLVITLIGPLSVLRSGIINFDTDWQTADRSSAGIAPDPHTITEAIVQVYAARAYNWRGIFAVHTWIATKPAYATDYYVHQKVGWRKWQGLPVIVSEPDIPDKLWYGITPEIILDLRGPQAEKAIAGIYEAINTYPYKQQYVMWPGPNSNTFTAYIYRKVPELDADLPVTAIGKDFLSDVYFFSSTPSNTGSQASLLGLVGIAVALKEGIELNILGLVFGIDPIDLAIKLPGIGQIGLK